MKSNDLVPYFGDSGSGPTYRIRQAILDSWDPVTLENSVSVGDAVLTNLTVNVNPSDLHEGDVIVLESWGSSWAIRSRVLIPNSAEALDATVQSITNRIQAAENGNQGSRNSNVYGDLTGTSVGPAVTARIGSGGRALVFWGAEMGQTANYQITNNPHVGVELSGANTVAASNLNALNWHWNFPDPGFLGEAAMNSWIQMSTFHLYTGLNPGDTTFTMKYRHDTNDPAAAVNFNAREIAVFVL